MTMRAFLCLACVGSLAAQTPWIVDTDAGTDDYMAIAYLLAKPNVRIEAIASVNGLSGAHQGAEIAARIVQLSGQKGIPVFVGAARALRSEAAFPAEWRKMSEELPGVALPPLRARVEAASAFYLSRLQRPARILALGPLTNLALVLQKEPSLARNIQELVIMGGAVDVPGNLGDGGFLKTKNRWAEWNIYMDPEAAEAVFRLVPALKLVPLDATNRVPFRVEHVRAFEKMMSPLGKFVAGILRLDEPMIRDGYYFAWDPLAAVVAAEPGFAKLSPASLGVRLTGDEAGRTVRVKDGKPSYRIAVPPPAEAFHREFSRAFAVAVGASSR